MPIFPRSDELTYCGDGVPKGTFRAVREIIQAE